MRNPTTAARRGRRGAATVLIALSLVVVLFGLGAAYARVAFRSDRASDTSLDDRRARSLADAGVVEALAELRAGGDGVLGAPGDPVRLGGGVLWTQVDDLGGDRYRVVATAAVGGGRAAVEAVVETDAAGAPLFWTAMSSDEELTLNAGVMVDSYDSLAGDYASQAVHSTDGFVHANTEGHVASNEDVVLNANAHAFGDATPGVGHAVVFNAGSYVHGSTAPASAPLSFPPVAPPPVPKVSSLSVPNGATHTLAAGTHGYTSVTINKDATLVVEGPATLVVDDFSGMKDATLEIDASGGPVTIHVADTYSHGNGFEAVPSTGSPMAVAFFLAGPAPISFPSRSKIRGAYYAPDAELTFTADNEAWGSFAARRVSMSSGMKFHYDENLAEHWEDESGGNPQDFAVLSWVEADVEPTTLLADRRDPGLVLGVDVSALPSPYEAFETP